jgi:CBS domain-containing protein
VAYGFTVIVMPRSILTEKIARRGLHVFREYGVDPLERHFVDEVMTREVVTISGTESLASVLTNHFGADQKFRAYPVVLDGKLLGMIDRSVINHLKDGDSSRPLSELLSGHASDAYVVPSDTCRTASWRLAADSLERLPVVDSPSTRRVIGIVSRSDLVKPSRVSHEEEVQRDRALFQE